MNKQLVIGMMAATMVIPCGLLRAADYYVATSGSDANNGSRSKPFASLERARDAIRELKKTTGLPNGGVTVHLHGGKYILKKTFELLPEDSGEKGSPITYTSFDDKAVVISSEQEVTGWELVTKDLPGLTKNKGENSWINNVVANKWTPAYKDLLTRIVNSANKEGGWLGNPDISRLKPSE